MVHLNELKLRFDSTALFVKKTVVVRSSLPTKKGLRSLKLYFDIKNSESP